MVRRSARRLIRADRLAASTKSRLQAVGYSAKIPVKECFGSACAITSQVTGLLRASQPRKAFVSDQGFQAHTKSQSSKLVQTR
jgi:hypothetical protein